ncbi:RAI1 like PD-XK nuclease-domain-containing protein [Absidia repens]|uniref:Decapping nuclease n=1 Tax=Absidia repens TaxID=90262 RepID=A0A1X2J0D3_9FUNG|nr:RAI1 like PD-XK nuclease-domain-containing protein [Absidia repens]
MSKRKLSFDYSTKNTQPFNRKTFPVLHTDRYAGSSPVYKQPREINSYSIDADRRVWFDDRELKYYFKFTGHNLNLGFDKFIKRDESLLEHLDTLLDAVTDARRKTTNPNTTNANFITWRGIMTKLLCTPYCRNEPWELRATKYNDTIFIEEQTTAEKKEKEAQATVRQQLMSYWGYKFETLSTISILPKTINRDNYEEVIESRIPEGADTNVQYCVAVKTTLGKNSVIMGAEVDCSRDEKCVNDPLRNYIELKTSRYVENEKQRRTYERFKLLKFWAQSFLAGVPTVIVGFRDDDGYIKEVKSLKTLEIPRQVRGRPGMWDPSVCLNFANQVLDWLSDNIVDNDPTVTYCIKWQHPWRELVMECTGHDNVFLTKRFIDGEVSNNIGGPRADV